MSHEPSYYCDPSEQDTQNQKEEKSKEGFKLFLIPIQIETYRPILPRPTHVFRIVLHLDVHIGETVITIYHDSVGHPCPPKKNGPS